LKTIKKTKAIAGLTPRGETDLRRFSVYPSRAVLDHRLSINDIKTLLALGLHTNGSGVAFPTHQTISHYTGIGVAAIQASIRRLQGYGLIRRLEPKWFKGQSSPWLTDRYQVLYSAADPLPSDEQIMDALAYNVRAMDQAELSPKASEKDDGNIDRAHNDRVKGIENCFRSILNTYGVTVTQSQFIPASSLVSQGIELDEFKRLASLAIAQWLRSKGSVPSGLQQLVEAGAFSQGTPSPPPRPL
jgi:hypothetical protein